MKYLFHTAILVTTVVAQTPSPTTVIHSLIKEAEKMWQIGIVENSVDVRFSEGRENSEVIFNLNVTEGQSHELHSPKVYDFDTCSSIQYTDEIIELRLNSSNSTVLDGFELVPTTIDIKTNNLNAAPYYGTIFIEDLYKPGQANIKFCISVELGHVEMTGVENGSISFVKMTFDLTVSLLQGITSVNVDLAPALPDVKADRFDNEYRVESCICDSKSRACVANPSSFTQNSAVNICIQSLSQDVVVEGVKSFNFYQSSTGYSLNSITNGIPNRITSFSEMGSKNEVVSTRLISSFFIDPSPVTISGVVVLGYAHGRRKLGLSRSMQDDIPDESSFSLQISLEAIDESVESRASLLNTKAILPLFLITNALWLLI